MAQPDIHKKKILNTATVFLLVGAVLSVLAYLGYQHVMHSYNVFTDFLVGENAYFGNNKTGEWHLFWILLFIGMILTAALAFLEKKDGEPEGIKGDLKSYVLLFVPACFPMLTQLLIYGKIHPYMAVATLIFCILLIVKRQKAVQAAAHFLTVYFALEAVAVFLAIFLENYVLGDKKLLALSVVIFTGIEVYAFFKKCELNRFYVGVQAVIPVLFLSYIKDTYQISLGVTEKIPFPPLYRILIWGLVLCLTGITVYLIIKRKYWRENADIIFFPTVFSVFAFVSYISPAMILPFDLHHHGEQILPWQQIMELSQKPYADYAPASGLFPMISGFFQEVLFGGKANAYGMNFVLFALLFEGLTMYLLYRKVGGTYALFIAFLFHMPVYCRGYMILPVLLLLSDKKLVKNRTTWLLCYIFSCFLSGLYYPLYGAAVLLGGLPFAFLQAAAWIKKPDFKRIYTVFLVGLFTLVLISLPLLFRMLKHVLIMGDQTVNVDGMSIFSAEVPEWFMPYAVGFSGYNRIYEFIRLLLPVLFACFAVYMLCRFYKNTEKSFECYLQAPYFMLSSVPPLLCICYTYTMVCMDEDWVANLLSRSAHILTSVCGIFAFAFLICHGKKLFGEKKNIILLAVALSVPFLFFYQNKDVQFPFMEGTTDSEDYVLFSYQSKLLPYAVRGNEVLLTEDVKQEYSFVNFERIGEGFVSRDVLEKLNKLQLTMDYLKLFDPEIRILGFQRSQMYYYLLNEKAVYTGRTSIARSRKAVKPLLSHIDPEHTVVGTGLIPLEEYYLYRYLTDYGYAYSEEYELFLPKNLYRRIYGTDGDYEDSVWTQPITIHAVANSFAKSLDTMKTMEPVRDDRGFTMSDTGFSSDGLKREKLLSFENAVNGEEADFIYIKLDAEIPDNQGDAYFLDVCFDYGEGVYSYPITVRYADGELLLPVGINADWLTGNHDGLLLSLYKKESSDETGLPYSPDFSVKEIRFCKLQRE